MQQFVKSGGGSGGRKIHADKIKKSREKGGEKKWKNAPLYSPGKKKWTAAPDRKNGRDANFK